MRLAQALIPLILFAKIALAEPEVNSDELPRIAPTEPSSALETFELKNGFQLDLVAHEPLVQDPIDMAFDADGHLFVVEMRGYSEMRDEARGRIRLLKDTDGDGTFEHATVYADGLKWPTSVTCFDGGIFVIASPDIWYFRDTDNDGVAEERRIVFTGFGAGSERLNVQALPNGLQWGPDNRIWGATSRNGGRVGDIQLNGSDFSFDPRKLDLRLENGTAQNGMSFDSLGRRFVCSNSDHLIAVMWERSWLRGRPNSSLPHPFESIAVDGGAAPVWRISPDEPWRIVRTRWRVAGVVGGPVEGGGRVSGYFTGASGVTIYTGDAFGKNFSNNAFTGDVGSNLVHRKLIRQKDGLTAFEAERPADEKEQEFLASTDNWFRPANFSNAPDGCFYIADMYREIIEHPWSLPPGIKKHLDLNSGTERGRIYRVRPNGHALRKSPKLSAASNDELADLLTHPNGWHRRTAQRLLWERGDKRAGNGWAPAPRPELQNALDGRWQSSNDSWLQSAMLQSLTSPTEALNQFRQSANDSMRIRLAEWIGKSADQAAISSVVQMASKDTNFRILGALKKAVPSVSVPESLQAPAFEIASDSNASDLDRISAIPFCQQPLEALFRSEESEIIRTAILETFKSAPSFLLDAWNELTPALRARTIDLLLSSNPEVLIESIEKGTIQKSEMSAAHIKRLRKDKPLRPRALALFPKHEQIPRKSVLAKYQKALSLEGDAKRGGEKFRQLCIGCHRNGKEGFAIGPDASTFQTAGAESILTNLIAPNQEVAPQYLAYQIDLKAGDSIAGIIVNESTTHLTIRQAFGLENTFAREDVAAMKSTGKSLMPEGLEAALTLQDTADLLQFLRGK